MIEGEEGGGDEVGGIWDVEYIVEKGHETRDKKTTLSLNI
jgi:hypothetical protein